MIPEPEVELAGGRPRLAGLVTLCLVLVWTPLAFGGVQAYAWAGAAVVALAGLGAEALGDLRRGAVELPRAPLLGVALALGLWVLVQLLPLPAPLAARLASPTLGPALESGALAAAQRLTVDLPGTLEALLKGGLYLAVFLLAAQVGRRRGQALQVLAVLVGLATFEALYGLQALFAGGDRIFGFAVPGSTVRASGTFVNPNHYAALLALALPSALALGLVLGGGARPVLPRRAWPRLLATVSAPDFPKRALPVGAAVIVGLALAASLSRAGVVAATVGVVAFGLAARGGARDQTRARRRVTAFALGLTALWVASLVGERLAARFERLDRASDPTVLGRVAFTRDTLRMAGEHPWFGVGAGAFEAAYPTYGSVDLHGMQLTHAHDDWVQLLAELGVPGLVLLLVGVAATVRAIVRGHEALADPARRTLVVAALAGLLPLALHSLVEFNLRIPGVAVWGAALLGLAFGLAQPEGLSRWRLPVRGRVQQLAAGAVLVGGLVSAAGPCLYAWADWQAQPFVERARPDPRLLLDRVRGLERALAVWPWRADQRARLASLRWLDAWAFERAEARRAAARLLDPEREPTQVQEELARALLVARASSSEDLRQAGARALADAREAVRLAPADPRWRELLTSLQREIEALARRRGADSERPTPENAPGSR